MRNSTLVFIVTIAFFGGCNESGNVTKNGPSNASLTLGEGASASDGLSVTNGNAVLKQGQAGIAFAFTITPVRSKEFAYFIVFNHDFPEAGIDTSSENSGLEASGSHTITAFGNDCKVNYSVTLNSDNRSIEKESTQIAEEDYHRDKGRLFLIEMNSNPPNIVQLEVELPTEIPNLKEPDAAESFGRGVLNRLRETNKRVDEFCRRIEET